MVAEDFESVLKGKYPAKAHAKRTVELLPSKPSEGLIYLEATHTKLQEDNDSPEHFRQRRYFFYLTGCNIADSYYTYDIKTQKSTLFIPAIDPDDVIWSGLPLTAEDAAKKYDVDEVKYSDEVNDVLSSFASANASATVYAIENQIDASVKIDVFKSKDLKEVKKAIEEARVIKDEYEIAMIRKANQISGWAHKAVTKRAKTAKNESELQAAFMEVCIANNAKEMAYHPIMAAGRAAATLHYVDNSQPFGNKLNLLIDAGAEWENYASDITRTFPLNGKFSPDSRALYDVVLRMQEETTAMIKANVHWDNIHLHAHKVAIDGLIKIGVLKGDPQAILEARTSAAFFPHGLGHYLGLDTHDVGGNPNSKDKDIMFRYLRLRNKIPAGSVVTVEPGLYFCEFIIKPFLEDEKHKQFIDESVLNRFWDVGGVRIEDNVLVTENGSENLTDAIKAADEIEALFK